MALQRALGVRYDASLRRTLVHPGVPDAVVPPPRDAEHADHIAAAVTGLVLASRGHVHVECGRPARAIAWVLVDDGALVVEHESPDKAGTDVELGRFTLSTDGAVDAAARLAARLERHFGCSRGDPLFIALIGTEPDGHPRHAG